MQYRTGLVMQRHNATARTDAVPSQKASRAVLLARACSVAEGDALVNVVADGLNAGPQPSSVFTEPLPGGLGEPVAQSE